MVNFLPESSTRPANHAGSHKPGRASGDSFSFLGDLWANRDRSPKFTFRRVLAGFTLAAAFSGVVAGASAVENNMPGVKAMHRVAVIEGDTPDKVQEGICNIVKDPAECENVANKYGSAALAAANGHDGAAYVVIADVRKEFAGPMAQQVTVEKPQV